MLSTIFLMIFKLFFMVFTFDSQCFGGTWGQPACDLQGHDFKVQSVMFVLLLFHIFLQKAGSSRHTCDLLLWHVSVSKRSGSGNEMEKHFEGLL